jgi:hypothetical protein
MTDFDTPLHRVHGFEGARKSIRDKKEVDDHLKKHNIKRGE